MIVSTSTEPMFLYPHSRQFPFDEVCEQIVRALEERNWNMPGVTVDFDVYGTGEQKYRLVRYIKGDDFKLWFCRPQARLSKFNDLAAVTRIIIPGKELSVYDDESGPTLYVYVGKNWSAHKEHFMSDSKCMDKQRGKPRLSIEYEGNNYVGHRAPWLVFNDDLGRNWHRKLRGKRKNPERYSTTEVFDEFTQWLRDNLLARILAQPVAEKKVNVFHETVIPFPNTIGPIFCFGENEDARRVHQGKLDSSELAPADRYGLMGSGFRLLRLSTRNDGTVPTVAYDGFRWCGFGEVTGETQIDTLTVPGHYRSSDGEQFVFRITPSRADGIYVADNAPYEKRRSELFEEIMPRDRLTEAEIAETDRARARTIVPITEYADGYEQPVVLINRELDFDEVELVSGPWPEYQYIALIADRSPEARQLLEQALSAQEVYHRRFRKNAGDAYDATLATLADYFDGDQEFEAAVKAYSRQTYYKVMTDTQFMGCIVSAASESRRLGLI